MLPSAKIDKDTDSFSILLVSCRQVDNAWGSVARSRVRPEEAARYPERRANAGNGR
jgi:hypothetical protein